MIEAKKLTAIVDSPNVITEPSILAGYSRDISFADRIMPECVVRPGNSREIEQIVRLANESLTPLTAVSSGPPHFRGDTIPGAGETIIVDLSGMKKILHTDRQARVIMFEPGVTFGELISAAAKSGMRLNMPFAPRKTKSVAASMLEREPVIMPVYQWDIADPLCDVEVIFGSGQLFRTGAAAGPGTIEEQWAVGGAQKEAAGPSSNSWYRLIQGSQGTMGIVTWASARCEILPRMEEPFLAGSQDINRIMEMVHWLIRLRLVNECFILNSQAIASVSGGKRPAEYQNIKKSLPPWILLYNVAGYEYFPGERVNGQVLDIADIGQKTGLAGQKVLGQVSAGDLLDIARSPSAEPYWKLRRKGACQDIFFLSNYDRVAGLIDVMEGLAGESGYPVPEMGVYIQPLVQGTSYHCEFNLFYDPEDRKESEQVKALSRLAVKNLMSRGAFFSRPYGENTSLIMNADAATVSALKKVRKILDPNNIMNPGKLCF
ncbi:MAG: FAD-binding oxidoreductase [Dehalococcoidales bacterium]|nr:FAD-binding oxidoreductase [Dehalococcoidales bacterium]